MDDDALMTTSPTTVDSPLAHLSTAMTLAQASRCRTPVQAFRRVQTTQAIRTLFAYADRTGQREFPEHAGRSISALLRKGQYDAAMVEAVYYAAAINDIDAQARA